MLNFVIVRCVLGILKYIGTFYNIIAIIKDSIFSFEMYIFKNLERCVILVNQLFFIL